MILCCKSGVLLFTESHGHHVLSHDDCVLNPYLSFKFRSATNPRPKSRTDTRTGSNRLPSLTGARQSHMMPESERESMLQRVTEFMSKRSETVPSDSASHAPSRYSQAQAILCSGKRHSAPMPISEEAMASVQRKVTSTIDELVLNKDYKVRTQSRA